MRIKRIFAADMREAIRKVREQHGEDAVVISSRKVEGGVEVISAIDYDEEAVKAAAKAQDPRGEEIPPLDVPAGPRPGEPDADDDPLAFPEPAPSGSGNVPAAGSDEAEAARQAALKRLRELRAGVTGGTRPPGLTRGERASGGPSGGHGGAGGRGGLEFARNVGRRLAQHSDPGMGTYTPTTTPEELAAQSPVEQPRRGGPGRAPGKPRIDLRVGGEDDEELFSTLSKEHQQAEEERARAREAPKGRGGGAREGAEPRDLRRDGSPGAEPGEGPHQADGAQAQRAFGARGGSGGGGRKQRSRINLSEEPTIQEMREEIRTLRNLFENQLSLMEWSRLGRRHPARATVIKRLSDLGLGPDVARRLADHVRGDEDPDAAYRKALALIARYLPVTHDEIVNQGGVVALVGPTGVGKTTTVAKLAARFALRHGRERVALVSTDNYRIGAQDQLLTYARILDVPVYTAGNRHELRTLLDDLLDRGLVLIDTVGMSQRDVRLAEQFKTLGSAEGLVRTYLVLSASTQLSTLTESVRAFSGAEPEGCILTKVDEASTLGGALTCALRTRLPLAYLGVGQRVPEDLQAARGDTLVHKACALLEEFGQGPDEEALALSLGGGAHVPE